MNEEELKKGCGKEAGFITFTDDFGNKDEDVMLCGDTTKKINGEIELFLCDTCQARLEYFQKGKLEQKKEELKKWEKFKKDFCSYRSCDACMVNLEEIDKIIKQLQKEIHSQQNPTQSNGSMNNGLGTSSADTKEIREEKQDENS